MEMTLQEYNSKIFTIIENAIYNYEIEALVETADGEATDDAKKAGKLEKLCNMVAIGIRKVFDAILAALGFVIKKLADCKGRDIVLKEDLEINEGSERFDIDTVRLIDKLQRSATPEVLEEIKQHVQQFYKDTHVSLHAGAKINAKNIMNNCKKYEASIKKFKNFDTFKISKDDTTTAKEYAQAMKELTNILMIYVADIKKMLAADSEELATKAENKIANAAEKNSAKLDELKAKKAAMSESINDVAQLRANLLIEAARLLQEDADDYVDGIDGGENLYNDKLGLDKTVAKDDEYPADDVTGGEGITDDEDIKDLVNDDAEALKILKDDEPSADPQTPVTESVIIRF